MLYSRAILFNTWLFNVLQQHISIKICFFYESLGIFTINNWQTFWYHLKLNFSDLPGLQVCCSSFCLHYNTLCSLMLCSLVLFVATPSKERFGQCINVPAATLSLLKDAILTTLFAYPPLFCNPHSQVLLNASRLENSSTVITYGKICVHAVAAKYIGTFMICLTQPYHM